ncbi:hypothetical protein HDU76_002372 [Blyttiomyces sp. JEL0837]|nr:hypothetical protein HDU76_002372 [Blyttiomyces sp. JEL0837]
MSTAINNTNTQGGPPSPYRTGSIRSAKSLFMNFVHHSNDHHTDTNNATTPQQLPPRVAVAIATLHLPPSMSLPDQLSPRLWLWVQGPDLKSPRDPLLMTTGNDSHATATYHQYQQSQSGGTRSGPSQSSSSTTSSLLQSAEMFDRSKEMSVLRRAAAETRIVGVKCEVWEVPETLRTLPEAISANTNTNSNGAGAGSHHVGGGVQGPRAMLEMDKNGQLIDLSKDFEAMMTSVPMPRAMKARKPVEMSIFTRPAAKMTRDTSEYKIPRLFAQLIELRVKNSANVYNVHCSLQVGTQKFWTGGLPLAKEARKGFGLAAYPRAGFLFDLDQEEDNDLDETPLQIQLLMGPPPPRHILALRQSESHIPPINPYQSRPSMSISDSPMTHQQNTQRLMSSSSSVHSFGGKQGSIGGNICNSANNSGAGNIGGSIRNTLSRLSSGLRRSATLSANLDGVDRGDIGHGHTHSHGLGQSNRTMGMGMGTGSVAAAAEPDRPPLPMPLPTPTPTTTSRSSMSLSGFSRSSILSGLTHSHSGTTSSSSNTVSTTASGTVLGEGIVQASHGRRDDPIEVANGINGWCESVKGMQWQGKTTVSVPVWSCVGAEKGVRKEVAMATLQIGIIWDEVYPPVPKMPEIQFADFLNIQVASRSGGIWKRYWAVIKSGRLEVYHLEYKETKPMIASIPLRGVLSSVKDADMETMCAPNCIELHFAVDLSSLPVEFDNDDDGVHGAEHIEDQQSVEEHKATIVAWRKAIVEEETGSVYCTADSKEQKVDWESKLRSFLV